MLNEKEYEEFKEKVKDARANRLYVSWRNVQGKDCKTIGPSSSCFCGHRYKFHNFDNIKTRQVHCREPKCKCALFDYVPVYGSADLKCLCKHSYRDHTNKTKKCKKCPCMPTFTSKHGCSCGMNFDDHETVFESREEREAAGRQVEPKWKQGLNMIGGMGGLTGFSDLADGQEKEDFMD